MRTFIAVVVSLFATGCPCNLKMCAVTAKACTQQQDCKSDVESCVGAPDGLCGQGGSCEADADCEFPGETCECF